MPVFLIFWSCSSWHPFFFGKIDSFILEHDVSLVLGIQLTKWLQIWQVAGSSSPLEGHKKIFIYFKMADLCLENWLSWHLSQPRSQGARARDFTDLFQNPGIQIISDKQVIPLFQKLRSISKWPVDSNLSCEKYRPESWTSNCHHLDLRDGCTDWLETLFPHKIKPTDDACVFESLIWF